jgi:predicted transcriptional regulator
VEANTIFTQNDYKILKAIVDRGDKKKGLCKTEGTTIKELIEKTELSDKKIRNTLVQFLEVGYISEGASIGKARTYILTKEGFMELNSLRKNIFGEV